jgi:hypothetical protein
MAINPTPLMDYLSQNINTSSYDMITSLLSANNFDFVPLPSFINYRDPDALKSVFKPYPTYNDVETNGFSGPSFVCVYVGQTSNSLDFNNSNYPNDGFDYANLPPDFTGDAKDYEDVNAFFNVGFGQQNQNIFKDVVLDQSEFGETAESLQIIDDISQKGGAKSFGGQNLYNVYSVRSYKAEIEMLGNAMIQPMMYFQLDNIPMFHGAYMITRVKHSIKPNTMSTNFTGVRIKTTKSPIFDTSDFYMSFLQTINAGDSTLSNNLTTTGVGGNYIDSYYVDLINNKPTNLTIIGSSTINALALTKRAEEEIVNWGQGSVNEKDGVAFLDKYSKSVPGISASNFANDTQPWSALFTSYVMLAGDPDFPKSLSHYGYVTAAMNGIEGYEAFPLENNLKIQSQVGDLFCKKRSGGYTNSHCDVVYKIENNTAYLVGGNLGNSIQMYEIVLDNGFITDKTAIKDYAILVKNTENEYYNLKKIIGTGPVTSCPVLTPKYIPQESLKKTIENIFNDICTYDGCAESLAGFKTIPSLYSEGKLTKKGIFAMSIGIKEGFGANKERRNPGNLRKNRNSFKTFATWGDGWKELSETYIDKWISGDLPATASSKYVNCYKEGTDDFIKKQGVTYTPSDNYNYTKGNPPTLRQYINIYAPWGDKNNPTDYFISIAKTFESYDYKINVDEILKDFLIS